MVPFAAKVQIVPAARRPERRRSSLAVIAFASVVMAALLGGGCGSGRAAAGSAVLDDSGRPVPAAAAGAEPITWRVRASAVLGAMDSFFDGLQSSTRTGMNRQAVISACAGIEPHLSELSLAIATPYPDAAVERHVREAVSGFSQYVRACAVGDDAHAEAGYTLYDEGSQGAARALTDFSVTPR